MCACIRVGNASEMKTNNCFAKETNCYTNYQPSLCFRIVSAGEGGPFINPHTCNISS